MKKDIKESVRNYLKRNNFNQINLKTVLFDMDGVLYDSMPNHAYAWEKAISSLGIECTQEEFYLYEGQTGHFTIDSIFRREKSRPATEDEKVSVYKMKSDFFVSCGKAPVMKGAKEVLTKTITENLKPVLVTGSGQASLIDKLQENFPNVFTREFMVTAYDVKKGKPDPEPYLMGLSKTGSKPFEAFVVENAPLGVRAASAANIFTVAVTTGPIKEDILYGEGADIVFSGTDELLENFDLLLETFKNQHQ